MRGWWEGEKERLQEVCWDFKSIWGKSCCIFEENSTLRPSSIRQPFFEGCRENLENAKICKLFSHNPTTQK